MCIMCIYLQYFHQYAETSFSLLHCTIHICTPWHLLSIISYHCVSLSTECHHWNNVVGVALSEHWSREACQMYLHRPCIGWVCVSDLIPGFPYSDYIYSAPAATDIHLRPLGAGPHRRFCCWVPPLYQNKDLLCLSPQEEWLEANSGVAHNTGLQERLVYKSWKPVHTCAL